MHGLFINIREINQNLIRRSRAKKERTFLLNAVNLSRKSPTVEINCPKGNRLEWFFCTDALKVFTESRISWEREGTNLPVHAYRSNSHFCLSFLWFSFFPFALISLLFLLSFYFLVEVPVILLLLFTVRPSFYSACRD